MQHTISQFLVREALDLADINQSALRQGYQGEGTWGSSGFVCLVLDGHREFAQFMAALGMVVDQNSGAQVENVMRLAGNVLIEYANDANYYHWPQLQLTD